MNSDRRSLISPPKIVSSVSHIEEQNNELRSQISKLSSKKNVSSVSHIEEQNNELRSQISNLSSKNSE